MGEAHRGMGDIVVAPQGRDTSAMGEAHRIIRGIKISPVRAQYKNINSKSIISILYSLSNISFTGLHPVLLYRALAGLVG